MITRRRNRTLRTYVLTFTITALLAHALLGERGAIEIRRARRDARAVMSSIAALRAENARLRTDARLLRSDRQTIEMLARQELGLAARGERLVIVTARD